jgi:hypothetical protein
LLQPAVLQVYADGAQESTLTGDAFREFIVRDIANYKRVVERKSEGRISPPPGSRTPCTTKKPLPVRPAHPVPHSAHGAFFSRVARWQLTVQPHPNDPDPIR